MAEQRTYTSQSGLGGFVRELRELRRRSTGSAGEQADRTVGEVAEARALLRERTGVALTGLRVLDVGCGQTYQHARVLAVDNTVVGVDYDIVPVGLAPLGYLAMARQNGWKRAVKTIGRKALGVDRALADALAQRAGARAEPSQIVRADAADLPFPDASFDAAFSSDTFEHLERPEAAMRDIARVLRPGGVAFVRTHLYTSDSGHHDLRTHKHADWSAADGPGPDWGHLRPETQAQIEPNAWVNKVRLPDWQRMFTAAWPGCAVELVPDRRGLALADRLAALRAAGELAEYSDEELLTVDVLTMWRKPDGGGA